MTLLFASYSISHGGYTRVGRRSLVKDPYLNSNESYFIFNAVGEIKAIPVEEVAALYLSAGVEKAILSTAVETEPERSSRRSWLNH